VPICLRRAGRMDSRARPAAVSRSGVVPKLVELDGGPFGLVRSPGEPQGDPSKIEGGTAVKETTVSVAQAVVAEQAVRPARVQEARGELVGAAREGLLALSVGVGLGMLAELMEEEVDEVVGPKGRHNLDRVAVRHGHESGEVTLGCRRVGVERPRVRSADGQAEVRLRTYEHFADRDPLARVVMERMLASVSTRRYARTAEPVGSEIETKTRSTSKSSVSRTFIERTREALAELDEPPAGTTCAWPC
jgi:hypothetical protein